MNLQYCSELLEEIADLLELKEENEFKVKSFRSAAQKINYYQGSYQDFYEALRSSSISGIGEKIAQVLLDFAENNHQSLLLNTLRSSFPKGYLDLLKVSGLGTKKLLKLTKELDIQNISQLKEACQKDQISQVKGFGLKTQDKFLAQISFIEKSSASLRLDKADKLHEEIVSILESSFDFHFELVGELKRSLPTISKISYLVRLEGLHTHSIFKDNFDATLETALETFFATFEKKIIPLLEQKKFSISLLKKDTSLVCNLENIKLEIIVSNKEHFLSELLINNSDEEYLRNLVNILENKSTADNTFANNIEITPPSIEQREEIRALCKKSLQNIIASQNTIACEGDEEKDCEINFYRQNGIIYQPPIKRERSHLPARLTTDNKTPSQPTSIQDAANYPNLILPTEIKGLIHCHSKYSDGLNTLEELATAAIAQGFLYLGISDHSQSAVYANGLKPAEVLKQHQEIEELNKKLFPFKIFKGIESDILVDGSLDYDEDILKKFDFVIASVHSRFSLSKEEMTTRLINAIKNPYTKILGHPSGRLLLQREPYEFDSDKVLEALRDYKKVVEINSDPHRLDLDWENVIRAKELGIRFSINPDAHSVEDFSYIRWGVDMANKANLTLEDLINSKDSANFLEVLS